MGFRRGLEESNPTRRGRVGGEGLTEPYRYVRPFPGEHANESLTGHQVNVYRIPCREQLWLFRRPHFHDAESVGEKVTPCEFAVKIPHMAGGTAERS